MGLLFLLAIGYGCVAYMDGLETPDERRDQRIRLGLDPDEVRSWSDEQWDACFPDGFDESWCQPTE